MALLNQTVQVYGKIRDLFETLRQGQAPDKFTREYLKDIGFKSSNDHAFIPLLKGLGFLTADGTPTQIYKEFLDETKSKKIIAEAVRQAYSDVFVIKSKPGKADRKRIAGKYKSTYNLSHNAADRAAATFLALVELSDADTLHGAQETKAPTLAEPAQEPQIIPSAAHTNLPQMPPSTDVGLHYNIQIHLPATKDVEVYNAIFKSIREHLID